MHAPADMGDHALISAVDLSAELVTGWPAPRDEYIQSGREPMIYRVGRPPFTQAAGVGAARHATALILRLADRAGATERALIDTAFRIGMSSGTYAARHALGHPWPTFPPPRETPAQWHARLAGDLSDILVTRLAVDPPPDEGHRAAAGWQRLAQRLRGITHLTEKPANSETTPAFREFLQQDVSAQVGRAARLSSAVLNAADITARLARSLYTARTEAGLSQERLADQVPGVRSDQIGRWEHGRVRMSERKLLRFVEYFPYDLSWWYADHPNGNGP